MVGTKKVYSFIFCIWIFVVFVLALVTLYGYTANYFTSDASYDGSEDYPIEMSYAEYRKNVEETLGNDSIQVSVTDEESKNILRKMANRITVYEEKIESCITANNILFNTQFIEAKKRIDKMVGLDMTVSLSAQTNDLTDATDVVVETDEGQLGWVQDDTDISESLDNLIAFGLDMEAEGRNFIYLQNPNKYADSIPYSDYSDKYYEMIADAFDKYNLDMLDYGEALSNLGMTESDIYYNTDHHWKPSTGIIANKILCEYLNANYGYDFDVSNFELDQYTTEIYEGLFLGSLGKKVSTVYAEPDDFIIYYPIYDTDLTVYRSDDDITRTGTVADTLFNYDKIEEDLYNVETYLLYAYGNQPLIKIHNNLVNDGSHIILIKTSFANFMIPYLATVVEDLDVIDPRHFSGSIRSYIDEMNPDTVIVIAGLSQMESASAEDTLDEKYDGAFDFR